MELQVLATVLLLALFCTKVSLVFGDIGTASAYNPPYLHKINSLPETFLWQSAKDCGIMGRPVGGRRYRIRCLSGKSKPCKDGYIEVEVVNLCPKSPCPSTLYMSKDAFAAISHTHTTRVNVEFMPI